MEQSTPVAHRIFDAASSVSGGVLTGLWAGGVSEGQGGDDLVSPGFLHRYRNRSPESKKKMHEG